MSSYSIGQSKSLLSSFLVLVGFVVLGLFLFYALAVLMALPFIDGMGQLADMQANPDSISDSDRLLLLFFQGFSSLGGFVVAPLFYIRYFEGLAPLAATNPRPIQDALQVLWALMIVPALIPILELTVAWNRDIDFPAWLAGFEQWAQAKEHQLEGLTKALTSFSSVPQFLVGLLVVAVIPAVGEELLFRGILQPTLLRSFKNPHIAIWATAIIFSAIHVQFYGFVPRMLLGSLFGYLYLWSGSLYIPILAHFANNGLTLTLIYLNNIGLLSINPDAMPQASWPILVGSAVLGLAVLIRFRARYYDEA